MPQPRQRSHAGASFLDLTDLRAGASALQSLLDTQKDSNLRVFVVWEPVLATDLSAPSTIALRRIHDARVKQYWDGNRVLSHAMGEHDRPSVVWDYVAVYKPEQLWTDAPPEPEFKGKPVARFIDGTRNIAGHLLREEKLKLFPGIE